MACPSTHKYELRSKCMLSLHTDAMCTVEGSCVVKQPQKPFMALLFFKQRPKFIKRCLEIRIEEFGGSNMCARRVKGGRIAKKHTDSNSTADADNNNL